MKTTPVSLIVAGLILPVIAQAQPKNEGPGDPPQENRGDRRGGQGRPVVDFWKSVDKDADGFLSKEEFAAMPRIQNLSEEKRDHLFQRLDKNSDGKLGRDELAPIRHDGQRQHFQRLWELDLDKSGGVSLDEFKSGEFFKKLPPEKQDEVFRRLDTNGDGVITPQDKPEMRFRRDGDKQKQRPKRPDGGRPDGPQRDPRQIIGQLDGNGDGALSFEEFRVSPGVKNLSEDAQEDRFEEMDKNHDQKLTPEDFPPRGSHDNKPPRPEGPPPAQEGPKD